MQNLTTWPETPASAVTARVHQNGDARTNGAATSAAAAQRRNGSGDLAAPLLEREAELRTLADVLAHARGGEAGIVIVEGTIGVGKSRLLEGARVLAGRASTRVLTARCHDVERDLPFGVALQLFEDAVAGAPDDERDRLLAKSARLAAPLVLEGAPESSGIAATLHGLYRLTVNLADGEPLVLLVDDLHWCDRPTLRFLAYLAERMGELPVAMAVAVAAGHLPRDGALLEELHAHPLTTVLHPRPLSPGAVSQWLGEAELAPAAPAFARACFDASAGNPWLLAELIGALEARGAAPSDGNGVLVEELAPSSIAESVLSHIRRMGKGALELAQAIAILGEDVELRHASALAGLPAERAVQLSDCLTEAGFLRGDRQLSFVQPLVGRALYLERPEFERAEAHLRAAEILSAEDADIKLLVPHVLAGRADGNARAVKVLLKAAENELRGGAPGSAVRLLRRALDEPPPPATRPDVLVTLGRAEGAAGAPGAVAHFTGALELISDAPSRAAVELDASRVLVMHGRLSEAAGLLERSVADAEHADNDLRARLEVMRTTVDRMVHGARCEPLALDLSDRALESSVAGRILLSRAAADAALGGTTAAEVRELATRALAGGALLDDETSDGIGMYLAVFALVVAEDLQTAELAAATAVEDARRRGPVFAFATACHFRSLAELRRGRIRDAAADAVSALRARRYGWGLALASAASIRAECHIEEGNLAHANGALQLYEHEDAPAYPFAYRFVGVRGRLNLLESEPEAALQDLLLAGRLQQQIGGDNPAVFPWRSLASAAAAALGDETEARRLAEEELSLAARFGAPGAHARALAAVAAVSPRDQELEAREEAARILDGSQAALDRAGALVELGAALRRSGRRREAKERLRIGLDLASRCGGGAIAKRAKDELVALGARPRRDASRGREALTAREDQVAGLAAQGMSNREIAEALFVTLKTVEWHLRHAYEKLGIRSRRDLGRVLAGREPASGATD